MEAVQVFNMESLIAWIAQVFGIKGGVEKLEHETIQFMACARCKHYRPTLGMTVCHRCSKLSIQDKLPKLHINELPSTLTPITPPEAS
jgi:hypothetical protein